MTGKTWGSEGARQGGVWSKEQVDDKVDGWKTGNIREVRQISEVPQMFSGVFTEGGLWSICRNTSVTRALIGPYLAWQFETRLAEL